MTKEEYCSCMEKVSTECGKRCVRDRAAVDEASLNGFEVGKEIKYEFDRYTIDDIQSGVVEGATYAEDIILPILVLRNADVLKRVSMDVVLEHGNTYEGYIAKMYEIQSCIYKVCQQRAEQIAEEKNLTIGKTIYVNYHKFTVVGIKSTPNEHPYSEPIVDIVLEDEEGNRYTHNLLSPFFYAYS